MEQDVRWKQRFQNYEKAFAQLENGIDIYNKDPKDIIKEGVIQRFEFTHELAWNLMKDFLSFEGVVGIMASKSATREALKYGLITNGEGWMEMIDSRNRTVHTYNEEILVDEFEKIITHYYPLLKQFLIKMKSLQ